MNSSKSHNDFNEKSSLRIVYKFNVAPEVVFDAFTKPEAMRVWWTDDTIFDIDLRVGSQWTITRKEGNEVHTMTGEYLEIDKPHRLVHSIGMPQFSPKSDIISIDITSDGAEECTLTFTQTGELIAGELSELPEGEVSESEKGWKMGFDLMPKVWADEK